MAEESSGDGWWGAWGTGFIENMKAKSAEAMSLVKNDLAEFVTVIQHDTTEVVADTASVVKDKLKVEEDEEVSTAAVIRQGMSDWLGKLSSTLKENIIQVAPVTTEQQPVLDEPLFDRMKARLHEIQTNPGTYCNEPDGPPSLYERWSEGFELDQHKGDISELLVNKSEIRSLYTKLVPGAVTHALFWNRYFYKLHQLEQDEKRRAALVLRADNAQEDLPGWGDEEDDPWDSNDVSATAIDNTEEQVEKENIGESRGVSKIPPPSSTEQQQLQSPVAENVTVKTGNFSSVQPIQTPVASRAAVSSDPFNLQSAELPQDEYNRANQISKTDISAKDSAETFVDITKGISTTESITAQNVVNHSATKMESVDPLKKTQNAEEILSKSQHAKDIQVLLEGDIPLVENEIEGNDKLDAGVAVSTKLGVTSGDGSCDPKPPAAVRSNSSDESIDSSWSKLSDEANNKGACGKVSPSLSSSSSSAVVVSPVDDIQSLDWDDGNDDNDDLDLDTDITEEEVKKMVEHLTSRGVDPDLDDDDWENWE